MELKNLLHGLRNEHLVLVMEIGVLAQKMGMQAYLVGGPVRDLLLGCSNTDLDIVVEGNALRLADKFACVHRGSKIVKYPAFKTAAVHVSNDIFAEGFNVDFATARRETYSRGGAFPKVIPSTIKDDLLRRDFTINAMAISVNFKTNGKIVDPFGGKVDLKAKRIRILHDQSYIDDPTRILRAARFMARLGFTMEAKTLKQLKLAIKMKVLDTIKPQRYLKDFSKIEKEANFQEAIKILRAWNALPTRGHGFSRVP